MEFFHLGEKKMKLWRNHWIQHTANFWTLKKAALVEYKEQELLCKDLILAQIKHMNYLDTKVHIGWEIYSTLYPMTAT